MGAVMDDKQKGAWIVHHATKIDDNAVNGLPALQKAGNCGVLLSALRCSEQDQLAMGKVQALASVNGIELTYQLPAILRTLKRYNLVDVSGDTVECLGLTTTSVLMHTSKIYDSQAPTPAENAAIEVAELCTARPRTEKELKQYIGDTHKLATAATSELMTKITEAELLDSESLDDTTKLYFNGSLFRADNLKKISAVFGSLSSADQTKITELNAKLDADGCIEKPLAVKMLGEQLFSKLQSIGVYDVNTVSNAKETTQYLTKPSAFNKFGRSDVSDAFDLAKAFVASLKYGMTKSVHSRGRIGLLERLMKKLIDGQTVGPCTAIGQDYKVLEVKRVIKTWSAGSSGYGFYMKLLKKDVGELALQVLKTGDASDKSLDVLPGSSVNNFIGPEINRVKIRKQIRKQKLDIGSALETLRTGSL